MALRIERVDNDDGSIRYEIHGGDGEPEDGWMIVFDERNDRLARLHAGMMMGALLGGQDVPDR